MHASRAARFLGVLGAVIASAGAPRLPAPPFAQPLAMRDALVRAGVTCELVALPGKDHGFDLDQQDPDVLNAVAKAQAFLNARLRP